MTLPLHFWGRVVHENDEPIPDATVDVSIRSWGNNFVAYVHGARFSKETLVTAFALSNRMGDVVGIESIDKPGYTLIKGQDVSLSFGKPGSKILRIDQPQVFRMLSDETLSSARLKSFKFRTRIGCENGVIGFDLARGTRSFNEASGELNVHFNRIPAKLSHSRERFDWILRIDVPDGGIAGVTEAQPGKGFSQVSLGLMVKAPESNYLQVHEIIMSQNDVAWRPGKTLMFYFKTGANYGKAVLSINASATAETIPLSLRGAIMIPVQQFLPVTDHKKLRVQHSQTRT